MKCPSCGGVRSGVPSTQPTEDLRRVRRRRKCVSCGHRWWTIEIDEQERITIELIVSAVLDGNDRLDRIRRNQNPIRPKL